MERGVKTDPQLCHVIYEWLHGWKLQVWRFEAELVHKLRIWSAVKVVKFLNFLTTQNFDVICERFLMKIFMGLRVARIFWISLIVNCNGNKTQFYGKRYPEGVRFTKLFKPNS